MGNAGLRLLLGHPGRRSGGGRERGEEPRRPGRSLSLRRITAHREPAARNPIFRPPGRLRTRRRCHLDVVESVPDGATILAAKSDDGVQAAENRQRRRRLLGRAVSPGVLAAELAAIPPAYDERARRGRVLRRSRGGARLRRPTSAPPDDLRRPEFCAWRQRARRPRCSTLQAHPRDRQTSIEALGIPHQGRQRTRMRPAPSPVVRDTVQLPAPRSSTARPATGCRPPLRRTPQAMARTGPRGRGRSRRAGAWSFAPSFAPGPGAAGEARLACGDVAGAIAALERAKGARSRRMRSGRRHAGAARRVAGGGRQ